MFHTPTARMGRRRPGDSAGLRPAGGRCGVPRTLAGRKTSAARRAFEGLRRSNPSIYWEIGRCVKQFDVVERTSEVPGGVIFVVCGIRSRGIDGDVATEIATATADRAKPDYYTLSESLPPGALHAR